MGSPKQNYLAEIEADIIWRDELQAKVVDEFERLYQSLTAPIKSKWMFKRKPAAPKGLYIFGSVGRGKTHLMDLFFDSLTDEVGKQRQHYHEFMLWLHHQLRHQGDIKNPLDSICKKLAAEIKILCLDEFLVNDIANAMLLAGMLQAFSRYGIALVTTSNVKPDNLYLDGLQRAKFMPAIEWIKQHMQVMHLDGEQDYRQQTEQQNEHWYFPINPSSEIHLKDVYFQSVGHHQGSNTAWQLNIIKFADKTLWLDFNTLCNQPRNAADYIAIANRIDTLIIQNIPNMSADNDNAARRFITLIDVMYENEVKIIAQAAAHYKMIYHGKKMAFEFQRAASRLAEMLLDS